jgi:outer membrane biosynthesis protein TonB
MSLYVIPLLIIVLLVLFLRRIKKRKKTGPSEEEYVAQVLKDVDQSQQQKGEAVEEPKEPVEPENKAPQPVEANSQTEPAKDQPQQLEEQKAEQAVEKTAPVEPAEPVPTPAPVEEPKPAPAKAKQRFTPSNPLIKQYETHLNLEMLRAQKAGDEDAYIDIVRKNSVYMKNCTLLNKALAEKDKEKALASLKKIREMIPKDFKSE